MSQGWSSIQAEAAYHAFYVIRQQSVTYILSSMKEFTLSHMENLLLIVHVYAEQTTSTYGDTWQTPTTYQNGHMKKHQPPNLSAVIIHAPVPTSADW